MMRDKRKILLTGATGYVGGKLLKRLEFEGYEVHCLVRDPDKLGMTGPYTTVYKGDVLEISSMRQAFEGVDTAFYLVHSLGEKESFEELEQESAENFACMARSVGVNRIIYLGALGNDSDGLSPHLRSRQNAGHILRTSGVNTLELRASIVLGAGSLSFEMIRSLAKKLPFMVMPKWVSVKAQPIGIRDLLEYLVKSMEVPLKKSMVVEIGGADRMSYRDLMAEYARQRGLKRLMVPVPVLTPWLSSHWLSLFTPIDATIGRKLIEGIRNQTVVENPIEQDLFDITPMDAATAMRDAIQEADYLQTDKVETFFGKLRMDRNNI